MKKLLLLICVLVTSVNLKAQCTKLKYYPPVFSEVSQTIKVADGYEERTLVKAGYYITKKITIVTQEGYIDYKQGCDKGYECSYSPTTVAPVQETIDVRAWVEPVFTVVYVEPVYETIITKVKIENAKVIQIIVDCE